MAGHPKHGGLEVLFVSSQVDEGNDLPIVSTSTKSSHMQYFLTDSPPYFCLVFSEHYPPYPILLLENSPKNPPTLDDFSQIFTQSRLPCSGLLTTFPWQSKPRMSLPTLLVLPDSISCLCRKSFCRAWPRPLSNSTWVKTPSRVLFPASTFPTTATLGRERFRLRWQSVANETEFYWLVKVSSNRGSNVTVGQVATQTLKTEEPQQCICYQCIR